LSIKHPVVKGCRDGDKIENYLSVEVKNTELCKRYIAKIVKNVRIKPSPRWMRERLRASGVRAINNIVDITNYVMLEYGQPMHAFDYKYVDGKKIVVRNAKPNETITTLDSVERKLSPEMLVIADENKASAIAGVMGGEYSSISNDTQTIIFESACFLGSSVRTTAKKVGLRTESSARFEKGLDPQNCLPAILRACELIELLDAGDVVDGIIDVDNSNKMPPTVKFEPEWINKFLGICMDKKEMVRILESLGFKVNNDVITVPSFRSDIEHKADIAEEIARIYGYNNIPTTALKGAAEGKLTERQKFERKISDCLLAQGLNEVSTYSFISPKFYDKINLPSDSPLRKSVTITNPLGEDTSVMRTTSLPSMLDVVARNYNNRNPYGYFYELATDYLPTSPDKLPDEKICITIGMYGGNCDFFDIKGIVEELFDNIDVCNWDIKPETENPSLHPGRSAKLFVNNQEIGFIGEIHPVVAENYGIETKVYAAKLDVDVLFNNSKAEKQYKPLPKFPASTRDLAVLCDDDTPVAEIEKLISTAVGNILEKIELFDVYKGKQVAENKKSVAFNIVMRASDRTLTDDDCDKAVNRILKALNAMGITLRS
ncbi:MAG TPA: phenylalanine--tRNA ligase subunit beta, partial [Ruminococcaceae bacterium]|nr:phenylalanine--tRNA ligase subunit beta [Oscillospiraceae bacterium]